MPSLRAFRRDYARIDYSIPEIVEHYSEWVRDTRYMLLSRFKGFENEIYAVKCAKRGNDVYRSRVYRRFKEFSSRAGEVSFFNPRDRGSKKTRALWVTLTYDSKRCSLRDAWSRIGVEFNRFMAYVRKKFGRVSCCRVFEAFENGYPHVHCILLFESAWFSVFRDRRGQFRIRQKEDLEGGWHSNIDVKAMNSLTGGFSYMKKYLLKAIDFERADSKGLKTLALCWAFMKRAFSVSGSFRRMLSELIAGLRGIKGPRQVNLSGEPLSEGKFSVIGFVPAYVVQLREDVWFRKLSREQIESVDEYLSRVNRS